MVQFCCCSFWAWVLGRSRSQAMQDRVLVLRTLGIGSRTSFGFLFIKTRPQTKTESVCNFSGGRVLIKRNSKEIWQEGIHCTENNPKTSRSCVLLHVLYLELRWKCRRHVATCRRRHDMLLQFCPDGSVSPTQNLRCRCSLCRL
jgi:hypothetical protein